MRNSMNAAVKCVLATLLAALAVVFVNARLPNEAHSAVPAKVSRMTCAVRFPRPNRKTSGPPE
jgi:hypothetical protein